MNEVERRVLERVEGNWEREVEFLRGLVRRPSTLGNEAGAQRFVAAELEAMGLDVDLWTIDHAEISGMRGYSPVEWSYEGRPNVAATWRSASDGGHTLILNGHVDVVPTTPDHHWTYDPYGAEIVDGRMYGRGAQDMKSGIAAMIFATRALMETEVQLRGDLTLQTVIEEECTGNGTLATLARGYAADAAIIPEPFARTGMISQVGVMWARVTVRGRGSHVQSADQAINAISKACLLVDAIRDIEKDANVAGGRPAVFRDHPHPLNYNVGKIRGGDWTSSVPEECVFEVRISAFPGADLDETSDRFKENLLRAARSDEWLAENPPEVTFYAFRAEGCTIDWEEPILAALRERHKQFSGKDMQPYVSTATTDARFFNLYAGIPATCYGPTGANLHAPDEWVDLESVREVTRVLSLTIMDWCGVT